MHNFHGQQPRLIKVGPFSSDHKIHSFSFYRFILFAQQLFNPLVTINPAKKPKFLALLNDNLLLFFCSLIWLRKTRGIITLSKHDNGKLNNVILIPHNDVQKQNFRIILTNKKNTSQVRSFSPLVK